MVQTRHKGAIKTMYSEPCYPENELQKSEIIRVLKTMIACLENNAQETGVQMVHNSDVETGHVWSCYLSYHGAP